MKTTFVLQISLFCIVLLYCSCSREFNFSQNNVFGEYCFAKNSHEDSDVWLLKRYKEYKPYLFSYIPCSYHGSYSLFSFDDATNFGPIGGGIFQNSEYDKTTPSECSENKFIRKYFFADDIYQLSQSEMSKIVDLENKYYELNWEITYDSNYIRLHYSDSTKVYISGFCTEKQLKLIKERKKEKLISN